MLPPWGGAGVRLAATPGRALLDASGDGAPAPLGEGSLRCLSLKITGLVKLFVENPPRKLQQCSHMAVFKNHYPGPGTPPEFSSLTALRDSIQSNCVPYLTGAPPTGGSPPAGVWVTQGWTTLNTADGPALRHTLSGQDGAAGNTYEQNFRFSTTLLGTLDPGLWWNGTDDPLLGKMDAFEIQDIVARTSLAQLEQFFTDLVGLVLLAGLSQGVFTLNSAAVRQVPNEGPSANLYHGVAQTVAYDPAPSETTSGFVPLYYDQFHATNLTGINVSVGNVGLGTATDATPVVVVQSGSQENSWQNLVDIEQTNIWNNNTTITHNTDLGAPSAPSNEPAAPDIQLEVFTTGNVLPAIVNGTTALTELTTVASLILGAIAGAGSAMIAWLSNLSSWTGAADEIDQCLPLVEDHLLRCAVALEAIQAQLTASSPVDGSTVYDQVKETKEAMDAVATTRSEIELQAKGVKVVAMGGVIPTP